MYQDYFASNSVSLFLSWIVSIPLFITLIVYGFQSIFTKTDFPKVLIVWLVICLLLFSPLRYIFLQIIVSLSYPVQSLRAFVNSLILSTYVPIVFGILYFIGIGLPILAASLVIGSGAQIKKWKYALFAIVLPVFCIISSLVFYSALPLAAWTVRWVNPADLIKATNGPALYAYKFIAMVGTPISLPKYYEKTPGTAEDLLRCHVAALYLGKTGEAYFVSKQYPEIFEGLVNNK